jgi:hypothetical protein
MHCGPHSLKAHAHLARGGQRIVVRRSFTWSGTSSKRRHAGAAGYRQPTAGKRVAKAHGDRSRRPHGVRRLLSGSTQRRGVNRRSISLIAASRAGDPRCLSSANSRPCRCRGGLAAGNKSIRSSNWCRARSRKRTEQARTRDLLPELSGRSQPRWQRECDLQRLIQLFLFCLAQLTYVIRQP